MFRLRPARGEKDEFLKKTGRKRGPKNFFLPFVTKILPFVTFGLDKSGFCGIIKAPKIPFGLLERYTFIEACALSASCGGGAFFLPFGQDPLPKLCNFFASTKVYLFGGAVGTRKVRPLPAFAEVRSSALQRAETEKPLVERCRRHRETRNRTQRRPGIRRASRGKRQTQRGRQTGGLEQGTDTETSGKAEGLAKNTRRKP